MAFAFLPQVDAKKPFFSIRPSCMSEGRKAGELSKEEFNQERILNMASGE